ncbi:MAG: alkaline phosphatase family protein, partial [Akkermansiaceae bacterium]
MKHTHLLLTISTIFVGTGMLHAAPGPGDQGTFGNKRVVLFGIDGCRADALKKAVENGTAPNMAGLIADGAVTWNAFAGGIQGTPAEQQTSSGSGWASVLTAVWRDKHGVNGNNFAQKNFGNYPHFFKRIKDEHPEAELSSLVSWSPIHEHITEDSGGDAICNCHTYTSGSYDTRDAELVTKTIELINTQNPDVVFCYQGAVDIAGHGNQFHPDNAPYMAALATADQRIGQVLAAIKNRPLYDQEDWLYIITSDHGGKGNSHGGQSAEERIIPFVVSGGASPKGLITRQVIGQVAAPATAFRHLGLSIPEAWGWESDAFMIGARLNSSTSGNAVYLSWDLPEAGIEGLTGFRLFRDEEPLATLDSTRRYYADTNVSPGETPVAYRLELTGSDEADLLRSSSRPASAAG